MGRRPVHGSFVQRDGTVYGHGYIGGSGMSQMQRNALDVLGRYYECGVFDFELAAFLGRMVRRGDVDAALAQARIVVDHMTRAANEAQAVR